MMTIDTHPFRHWIIEDFIKPLTSHQMTDMMSFPWEVSYDNDVERGKRTSRKFDLFPDPIKNAFEQLEADTGFTMLLSDITGIETFADPDRHGAGLHLSSTGSFLQAHVDYELHPTQAGKERRLNAILFMHHEWQKEWGGELLLCDMNGKAIVRIEPRPGRLAIFECGPASMHAVALITGSQAVRLSCAVYYLADARPTATRRRALFVPNRGKDGIPHEVLPSDTL